MNRKEMARKCADSEMSNKLAENESILNSLLRTGFYKIDVWFKNT